MSKAISPIEFKISQFLKKYYKNKLLKGIIFFIILLTIISFLSLLIEYYNYLTSGAKISLLLIYSFVLLLAFISLLLFPILGYFGINRNITQKRVNDIIVQHFPEIKDQLWNIIELQKQNITDLYSEELVEASINQKIESIKPFNFSEAIRYKENIKISIFLICILVLTTGIYLLIPELFQTSSQRLRNYSVSYEKPSPYSFKILNEGLNVGKGDDFVLNMKVETDRDFNDLNLYFGGNYHIMKNEGDNIFTYSFKNVNNSLNFKFKINDYESKFYSLNVLPKPLLTNFSIIVNPPTYTSIKNFKFENITELTVPIGSFLQFVFTTHETDTLFVKLNETNYPLFDNSFIFKKKFLSDNQLDISLKNSSYFIPNLLNITVNVIPDLYPLIKVDQIIDSLNFSTVYFRGYIEDDYGFSKLNFITKLNDQIDSIYPVEIIKNLSQQTFTYAFNFESFRTINNKIDYYFEIYDNDDVNGHKSTISQLYSFNFPTLDDIVDYQDEQFENIEDLLNKSMNLTSQVKQDIEDLKFKLLNSELTEWDKREVIKNIYSKKQDLESALKSIKERNNEMNNYLNSFTEQNQEIIDKQRLMEDMLSDLMSDELKALMDELNKMMDNFNENILNDLKEKIDISLDDLSKQIDRNLEMLKKMKMEQQLNLLKDEIDKHIITQKDLAQQLDNNKNPNELTDKQNSEKEDFKKLQDQYNKIDELNDELENKLNLHNFDNEFNEIDKEFDRSIEQHQKNNTNKSKQSIDKNKSNMENLAFMMQQMMDAAFNEPNFENIDDLFQILNNLIVFSFEQENVLKLPNNIEFQNDVLTGQKKLFSDFSVIKDSIYALSKREPTITSIVNKEIVNIENKFININKDLTEARMLQAKVNQQMVMTSANNLALFMSEVIKNLQQQMANSMPGNQNCQKPGNNPNPSSMGNSLKQMQKSLQQQLEKMMQMMKNGEQGSKMNGEMGKALAEQEKMKDMLQKLMNQGNVGSGAHETLKQAEQLLDKVREDIIRNNLSDNTLKRQQQILTRLLEADNAQNERDLDDKRKSTTADQKRQSETAKYFDNYNSNDKFEERLIRNKLTLNRFYQLKYQNYINQLDSIHD